MTDREAPAPRTALVLGLTGGYGQAMAAELARRGYALRALARAPDRARSLAGALGVPVEIVEGNLLSAGDLDRAAAGASVVVHGANAPYPRWEAEMVPMARAVADCAARRGATVLFPGNVYNFPPGARIGPDTPEAPPTRKGELRVHAEAVLREATERGARLVVLRGGDFFGLGHASSWMRQILAKVATGGPIQMPLDDDVRHAWCYLPDFARAHVDVLEHGGPPVMDLPFEGHVTTGRELTAALREALGDPGRKVTRLPWGVMRLVGLFSPMVREVVAMRYLWSEEVLLDPRPLADLLGSVPATPLGDALRAELRSLGIAVPSDPLANAAAPAP